MLGFRPTEREEIMKGMAAAAANDPAGCAIGTSGA